MADLTELDLCVLGVIWRLGPLSAYRVRTHFRGSKTAAWSSSTGSIYPAIKRLMAAGLVEASSPRDRRGTQLLTITGAGRRRLREWLLRLPAELGSATPDPIRTRAQFLTSIPAEERRAFLQEARQITRDTLEMLEVIARENEGDREELMEQVGTLGAIFELRGRLDWLDEVMRVVPLED